MMNRPNRRGYTLTELLVVVMIVVMLIGVTLPIAKRVMDDSRTREAARLLMSNFTMAQMYAARNGRPFGLWFELEAPIGDTTIRQCTKVYLAEVQAPYAGSTTSARGIIRQEPTTPGGENRFVPLVPVTYIDNVAPFGQWDDDLNGDGIPDPADTNNDSRVDESVAEKTFILSLIEEDEMFLVRFDNKGYWFLCQRGNTAAGTQNNLVMITSAMSTLYPMGYDKFYSPGYPFQILRSPRRVGNPMELTAGTCIDFTYSGMGRTGAGPLLPTEGFANGTSRLVVLFNSGGAVDGMFLDTTPIDEPTGTLHFLIGQVAKMNPPAGASVSTPPHPTNMNMFDPAASNLADTNSVWVSVGRRNGSVTSTENTPPPVDATTLGPNNVTIFPTDAAVPAGRRQNLDPTVTADRQVYLAWCRELATGRDQMGGN